ncbi:hypothetical protein AAA625_15445 [Pseudomonas aeruginosa]
MPSTQHQLIEQCAIRLRGIVEALDNIHDSTQHRSPHRWSTDLDDVHSSAESLLALINDQAPALDAQGLAQPSPAQAEQHWPKLEKPAQVGAIRFHAGLSSRLVVEAAQRLYEFESTPEQEAERPEVVGVRYEDGTILSAEDCGIALEVCAKVQTPLMTVAQHERIVWALRAVITQLHQHKNDYMDAGQETYRALQNEIREREAEIARLDGLVSVRTAERDHLLALIDSPELHDFANGVVLEAAHQRKRWGSQHDAGKQPADWFWLIGYLAGKALHACATGNTEKALHHCISSAAALGNWHASLLGADTSMRPGLPTESLPISAGGSDHA